jgi:hypothetical protein
MQLVLIAIIKGGRQYKQISGFRIIDSDTREVQDIAYNNVISTLRNGNATVDGIDVSGSEPKGSNGSFDRYAQIADGVPVGKCPAVILKEYANKVYDVSDPFGRVVQMTEQSIIDYASVEGLANGKVVNEHISSINGSYNADKSLLRAKSGDKLKQKMRILGETNTVLNDDNYLESIKSDEEAVSVGVGCLGICSEAFRECPNVKEIHLPSTCVNFDEKAFAGLKYLEKINIPDGTVEISRMCFLNCRALKEIELPNSIRKVGDSAFRGTALKKVSVGPVRFSQGRTCFPASARLQIRH